MDLQVTMCCTPNKLFLGKKDLTAAYLTYSKIKTFFRCAYLNTLDVFKFYESRQCCTTNSLTMFHNLICFSRFVMVHIYKIACNFQCVILVQYYIIHSNFCKQGFLLLVFSLSICILFQQFSSTMDTFYTRILQFECVCRYEG